jgi:hypothetical protein
MVVSKTSDGKKISFYIPEQAGEAVFYVDGEELKGISEPVTASAYRSTNKAMLVCEALGVESPARYLVEYNGSSYLFMAGNSLSVEQMFIRSIVSGTAPENIKITDGKITELVHKIIKDQNDIPLDKRDMALLEEALALEYKNGKITKGGKTLEISDLKSKVKEAVGGEAKDLFTPKYVRKSKAVEIEIIKEEFMKFMGTERQKRKYTKRKTVVEEQVQEPVVADVVESGKVTTDTYIEDPRISGLTTKINEIRTQVLADNKTPGGSISTPLHTGLNLSFDRLNAVLRSGKLTPELVESILAISKKTHAKIIIKNIGIIINRLYSEKGTNPDAEGKFIEKLNKFVDKPEKILDVIKQVEVIRDILKEESAVNKGAGSSIVLSANIDLVLQEMEDVLNPKEKTVAKVTVTKPAVIKTELSKTDISKPEVKLSTKDKEKARLEEVKSALKIEGELDPIVRDVVLRSRAGKYVTGGDIEMLKGVLSFENIQTIVDKGFLNIGDKRLNELYLDHMEEGYLDHEDVKKEVQSYLDANPEAIKMGHNEFKTKIESIISAKEAAIDQSVNDLKIAETKIRNAEVILERTLTQEEKDLLLLAEKDSDLNGSTFTLEELAKLVDVDIIEARKKYSKTADGSKKEENKDVKVVEKLNIVPDKRLKSSIDLDNPKNSALKRSYEKLLEERSSMTKAEFESYRNLGFKSNDYDLSDIERNGFRVLHEPMPGPGLGNYRAIYLYNAKVGLTYFVGVYRMPAKKRTGGHDYKEFFEVRTKDLIELVEKLSGEIGTTYTQQSISSDASANTTVVNNPDVVNKPAEATMNDLESVKNVLNTNGKLSLLQVKELLDGGLCIKLIDDAEKAVDQRAIMYIEQLLKDLSPGAGKYKLTEAQIKIRQELYDGKFRNSYVNIKGLTQYKADYISYKASAAKLAGLSVTSDNNKILEKAVDNMLEDISIHKGRMSQEVIGPLMNGGLAFFELFSKQREIVFFCSLFRQAVVKNTDAATYRIDYADKARKEAYDNAKLKLNEFRSLRPIK